MVWFNLNMVWYPLTGRMRVDTSVSALQVVSHRCRMKSIHPWVNMGEQCFSMFFTRGHIIINKDMCKKTLTQNPTKKGLRHLPKMISAPQTLHKKSRTNDGTLWSSNMAMYFFPWTDAFFFSNLTAYFSGDFAASHVWWAPPLKSDFGKTIAL